MTKYAFWNEGAPLPDQGFMIHFKEELGKEKVLQEFIEKFIAGSEIFKRMDDTKKKNEKNEVSYCDENSYRQLKEKKGNIWIYACIKVRPFSLEFENGYDGRIGAHDQTFLLWKLKELTELTIKEWYYWGTNEGAEWTEFAKGTSMEDLRKHLKFID